MSQLQQHQIRATSANYTTALGNAGSLTPWARQRTEPTTSWFLVRFVNHCATTGTPYFFFYLGPFNISFRMGLVLLCSFSFCLLENFFISPSILLLFFFCLFAISWAAPVAYGGSQTRGPIGAVAASLHQSHSNLGSEPPLQPTPQLTATPDPQPTEQGQGSNPQPHGS